MRSTTSNTLPSVFDYARSTLRERSLRRRDSFIIYEYMIPPLETDSTTAILLPRERRARPSLILHQSSFMPLSSFAGLRPAETIDSQAGGLALAKRDSLTTKTSTISSAFHSSTTSYLLQSL